MDLKKLHEYWNGFPEISMEERPLLSSDLEKIALRNPFSDDFYLKNKFLARIIAGAALWLLSLYQLSSSWRTDGADLYEQLLVLLLLSYFIYFNARMLHYASYSTLASLQLILFLGKIETLFDRYIASFRVLSLLTGASLLIVLEKFLYLSDKSAYAALIGNGIYKWLIIIFLSVSSYILFLHTGIHKYKRLLLTVRSYREAIILAKPQKQ
jgi:hypothetical protein